MTQLFHITHDVDLSEYTSTVTDAGDLSSTVAAALVGAQGMSALLDDTNAIYGEKTFTQITSALYRYRFYIDPNGLTMSSGDVFYVAGAFRTSIGGQRGRCSLGYDGANYEIKAQVADDGGATQATAFYDISDASHYVEVLIEYASSAVASDGKLTLWIDGTQKEQVTGIDLFDRSKPDQANLGAISGIDAGTSGTFYLDDFIMNDDGSEIGAAAAGGILTLHPGMAGTMRELLGGIRG